MFALIKSVKGLPAVPAVIIALVVGFGAGIGMRKSKVVEQYVPVPTPQYVVQKDTVWVPTTVTKYVTRSTTDTVIVVQDAEPSFEVYSRTTVDLDTEEARYGSIDIEYLHDPWDEFHTTFYPSPLPTVVQHEVQVQYKPAPLHYYQRPWFGFVVGAAFTYASMRFYNAH